MYNLFDFFPPYAKIYLYVIVGILGLVMGSALNCLSYRIAHNQKWSGGRSACPSCGHTLATLDLIPLFSWLFLKGKCRYCGKKISPRYPLTEALLALVFISLLWRYGLSFDFFSTLVLCSCLFCLSLVDLETMTIPNRFLIIPAVVRLIQLFVEGGFKGLLFGVIPGIALGGGMLIISLIMDKILKKDSMGGGDIKLLAVLGLFLSQYPTCIPQGLLLLLVAAVVGILFAAAVMKVNAETAFPFGPALAISAWLTLLFGQYVLDWYSTLFYIY